MSARPRQILGAWALAFTLAGGCTGTFIQSQPLPQQPPPGDLRLLDRVPPIALLPLPQPILVSLAPPCARSRDLFGRSLPLRASQDFAGTPSI